MITVNGNGNLIYLRSGQNLLDADSEEKSSYKQVMSGPLSVGMKHIQLTRSTGCYFNRFVRSLDQNGNEIGKIFSLSMWYDVHQLLNWTKSHVHKRIMDTGMAMYSEKGPHLKLRLWHEAFCLPHSGQQSQYFGCHTKTGLLNMLTKLT